jgi:GntR family transcriptional regulator
MYKQYDMNAIHAHTEPGALLPLGLDRLDRSSPMPLHAQIESQLRELIRSPEYQSGSLLPDEVSLSRRWGISRGTVRTALLKLVQEGLLIRKAGVGTRVAGRSHESGIRAWRSFTREMADKGIRVENYKLEYQQTEASEDAARALQVEVGTRVWRLSRVRGWDQEPVLHTASWFHPRLALRGSEDFAAPLYEVLEKASGVTPHHARETFLAVAADARMVRLLKVPLHSPLLLRRHSVFDPGDRPFEFAEVHYVSSRFTLTLELRRGNL